MEQKLSTVGQAKAVIIAELGNETTQKELVETVFKGLDVSQMKRAVLEGHLRGFTFKDFLEKNVYAIKYGNGYNLVTGIDFNRKRGMKGGIVGTDSPTYTYYGDAKMTVNGKESDMPKIESCTVTVKKRFEGGYIGDFTATVFFDEYYQAGKTYENKYTPSMWDKKPRTMIAKVAEMHALRKACPDELAQSYIEEEMHQEPTYVIDEPGVDAKEVKKIVKKLGTFKVLEELQTYFTELGKPWILEQDIIDAYEDNKQKLSAD